PAAGQEERVVRTWCRPPGGNQGWAFARLNSHTNRPRTANQAVTRFSFPRSGVGTSSVTLCVVSAPHAAASHPVGTQSVRTWLPTQERGHQASRSGFFQTFLPG